MSFTIRLETEDGEILESIEDDIENGFFNNYLANDIYEFSCLKYLDIYGITVFNNLQMDDLKKDLEKIFIFNQREEGVLFCKAILKLIDRCKNEVHTYLKFYGD